MGRKIHHNDQALRRITTNAVCVLLLLCCTFSYAQLPVFSLNIAQTEETCPGNGTLTFSTLNTDPAATVNYTVYALPDLINPIAVLSGNFLNGLTAGNYQVVATQTLGANSNSQTDVVNITSQIVPLTYLVSSTDATCGNNGTMTATITSGVGAQYEIISGPITAPLQPSSVFTGLAAGIYQVRVFDNCGQGWVITHTLLGQPSIVEIADVTFPNAELPACNAITISNTLSPGGNGTLAYPMQAQFTINPPDGSAPVVINQPMPGGDPYSFDILLDIPFYYDQEYSYDLIITDPCGNTFPSHHTIKEKLEIVLASDTAICGQYFLKAFIRNYLSPFTLNFTQVAAGFSPAAFNALYPGPFSDDIISFGDYDHPVPFGSYDIEIFDACGRTASSQKTLIPPDNQPAEVVTPLSGCNSYMSNVSISITGFKIVTAHITAAPPAYTILFPIPDNVSIHINSDGEVELTSLPTGHYELTLIDDCGNSYISEFDVPPLATSVVISSRTSCELGKGAIRIRGSGTQLVSVKLTGAPAGYPAPLPQDLSFNIHASGVFSMNGFLPGAYTFEVLDNCGITHTTAATVVGYSVTSDSITLTEHCGSFDLLFSHVSPGNTSESFWLQQWNPITGNWENPETGVAYVPGTMPDITNSIEIENNIQNYNLTYMGDFRIMKRFETFENGSMGLFKVCHEVIQNFTFNNDLAISDIQKVTCNGLNSDVYVSADGFPPFNYRIISKNNIPITIDNGNNPVFANLESAVYRFEVSDTCGNIVTRLTDVALLPSLIDVNDTPSGMVSCEDPQNNSTATFHLPSKNPEILGTLPAANYLITYHESLNDATNDVNPLPDDYESPTAVIYSRIEYFARDDCYDIASFGLTVNEMPELQMQKNWVICDGGSVTITADAGMLSYLWSTGETTQAITVVAAGIYTLAVTLLNNGLICTAVYQIEVVLSQSPVIGHIDTTDWTNDQNTITVVLDQASTGNFSFSLDNIHFQSENTFHGLQPGVYTVYIKDSSACDGVSQQVYLLAYPKFFTPNGDGYNDFWQIFYVKQEPNIKIYVFDRYGKLLTGFGAESIGWDGRYNGRELPSTDYWFLVIRENGNEHRGHFSMKR